MNDKLKSILTIIVEKLPHDEGCDFENTGWKDCNCFKHDLLNHDIEEVDK